MDNSGGNSASEGASGKIPGGDMANAMRDRPKPIGNAIGKLKNTPSKARGYKNAAGKVRRGDAAGLANDAQKGLRNKYNNFKKKRQKAGRRVETGAMLISGGTAS